MPALHCLDTGSVPQKHALQGMPLFSKARNDGGAKIYLYEYSRLVYQDLPCYVWVTREDNMLTAELQAYCGSILLREAVYEGQWASQKVDCNICAWACKSSCNR